MNFTRNLKPPPRKSAKQMDYTPSARRVAPAVGLVAAAMAAATEHNAQPTGAVLKTTDRQDQRIRDSANGEECMVRIPGVCCGGTETTVWSHFPGLDAGRGMGMKSLDLCGCYCCARCHDVVDMRAPAPEGYPRWQVLLDWFAGHLRSLVRLRQKGLA